MPLEATVAWFSDFDLNWPLDDDDLLEGDNHIRNIKVALLAQFPSLGDEAMTATAAELNTLDGITATTAELDQLASRTLSSTDDVIDNFPAGTRMLFQQAAAPTGWTRETVSYHNYALRINSTSTPSAGGTQNFTTVFGAGKVTAGTALAANQLPPHTHTGTTNTDGAHAHNVATQGPSGIGPTIVQNHPNGDGIYTNIGGAAVASGSAHAHSFTTDSTGSGLTHRHDLGLDVKYVDLLIAEKD